MKRTKITQVKLDQIINDISEDITPTASMGQLYWAISMLEDQRVKLNGELLQAKHLLKLIRAFVNSIKS